MVIALAGYNGFVGSHIRKKFATHEFILLERSDLFAKTEVLAGKISGCDVLINVAGFNISARWTRKNRERIFNSRINVTENLVRAMDIAQEKPSMFMNASAIGIYKHGEEHTEASAAYADDFLAEVVRKWESTAETVNTEVRLVIMRFGMVLGRDGGALPKLFNIFKWGIGGVIASGEQVYSFIHIEDLTGAISHILEGKGEGIYNFTAPGPVTNRTFTKAITKALHRTAILPIPGCAIRLVMGKAAIVVTKGQTVYPKRLLDEGYKFTFASVDEAISNLVDQ